MCDATNLEILDMISISETVAQLGDKDQVKAYQARKALLEAVIKAGGNPEERTALATALADELKTLTAKVKTEAQGNRPSDPKPEQQMCSVVSQLLGQVADDAQVPALVAALQEMGTREMSRWALDRIPTPAATTALIEALELVGPEFRVGVINALAKRRSPEIVAALHKQAADADGQVRLAAVEALANFAEPSNDEPIVAGTKAGSPRARARAQKARVRLADTLRVAGKKDAAIAIYKAIIANDADEPQKKAARLALERLT